MKNEDFSGNVGIVIRGNLSQLNRAVELLNKSGCEIIYVRKSVCRLRIVDDLRGDQK